MATGSPRGPVNRATIRWEAGADGTVRMGEGTLDKMAGPKVECAFGSRHF